MTKIKAKDGYYLVRMKGRINTKVHLYKKRPEAHLETRPLCKNPGVYTHRMRNIHTLAIDTCDLDDLCGNCKRIGGYTKIPKHITEMPDGHRIMKECEVITEECMYWGGGKGPWKSFRKNHPTVGDRIRSHHYPICCPLTCSRK